MPDVPDEPADILGYQPNAPPLAEPVRRDFVIEVVADDDANHASDDVRWFGYIAIGIALTSHVVGVALAGWLIYRVARLLTN
jgi:hypothetical protein